MSLFTLCIETIFPKKCAGCNVRGSLVCNSCKHSLAPASTPAYGFITSIFAYGNPVVRKLIHSLKYENGRYVASFFASYMSSSLIEFLGEEKLFHGSSPVLLVPVPLSKKRMKARGYNQSELLITTMLKQYPMDNVCLERNLVCKIKDTIPQAEIKKRNLRLLNQRDCFGVISNNKTKNETVIIVDDVTTTGATLTAVRDVLKQAGFKKVYALTIAH